MDALESIVYAYLKRIQGCVFVESGVALDCNNNGEGEFDLIGLSIPRKKDDRGRIYMVEATFQKHPYGGKDLMVDKLKAKFQRIQNYADSELKFFLESKNGQLPFVVQRELWAPRITDAEKVRLSSSGKLLRKVTIVDGDDFLARIAALEKFFERQGSMRFLDNGSQFIRLLTAVETLVEARSKCKKEPGAKNKLITP